METVRLLLFQGARHRIAVAIQSFLRLGFITTAFGAFLVVVNNLFDFALYPMVLCKMGFVWGVITLALVSIPFNQLLVAGFNRVGREIVMFPGLWRFLGRFRLGLRNKILATFVVTARDNVPIFTVIWCLTLSVIAPVMIVKSTVRFVSAKILLVWRWAGGHIKFITFLGLSAYDPIPAMIFAQQVYGIKYRSLSYATLFLISTIVANGTWAMLVYLGLEGVQAMDTEIYYLVVWCEEWATWAASGLGISWKADFGFIHGVLGTCKI